MRQNDLPDGSEISIHRIRLEIAREIVRLFLPERIIYMALSLMTAALILYVSFQLIENSKDLNLRLTAAGTLFGSGGIVAFNLARLLTMFNTVIEKVFGE